MSISGNNYLSNEHEEILSNNRKHRNLHHPIDNNESELTANELFLISIASIIRLDLQQLQHRYLQSMSDHYHRNNRTQIESIRQQLSKDERKWKHNRSCTLHQCKRLYSSEIICLIFVFLLLLCTCVFPLFKIEIIKDRTERHIYFICRSLPLSHYLTRLMNCLLDYH